MFINVWMVWNEHGYSFVYSHCNNKDQSTISFILFLFYLLRYVLVSMLLLSEWMLENNLILNLNLSRHIIFLSSPSPARLPKTTRITFICHHHCHILVFTNTQLAHERANICLDSPSSSSTCTKIRITALTHAIQYCIGSKPHSSLIFSDQSHPIIAQR